MKLNPEQKEAVAAAIKCTSEYMHVQYSPLGFVKIISPLLAIIFSPEFGEQGPQQEPNADATPTPTSGARMYRDPLVKDVVDAGSNLQIACHGDAFKAGWWTDLKTGEDLRLRNNVPEKLMLVVSELGEAMEGHRKDRMDDHLPHRKMLEVELADAVIRIFDLAGSKNMDLGMAIAEKMAYNRQRADHKPASRMAEGGKAY